MPDPTQEIDRNSRKPSASSRRGLDWLNFFLADVQTGVGPFLAIYLASHQWNEERVGIALTIGGIAGIAAQTPMGALVDRLHAKRSLMAVGVLGLALGAVILALRPMFWWVVGAQTLIGAISSIFGPAIGAISLGLVGHRLLSRRLGRNQTFNSAGNVVAAVLMGVVGYFFAVRNIFFLVVLLCVPTLISLAMIRPEEIDYDLARGARDGEKMDAPAKFWEVFSDRPLLIFLFCAVLFHFANAAMLPLLGEMLSKGKGSASALFMSACVVTTQLTITVSAFGIGRLAESWGRKPVMLIGFAALPIRGVLYTLTSNTYLLIGIQVLDGIGAGIFGVLAALMIADLTRGTGRFNFTQGAIATAV
ncbi:MAG TPA: MFS transporter, partial [Tepidisphaeraceae bacterium]|nr:MFS transporter [Tepidisphaeraceae bacterium]